MSRSDDNIRVDALRDAGPEHPHVPFRAEESSPQNFLHTHLGSKAIDGPNSFNVVRQAWLLDSISVMLEAHFSCPVLPQGPTVPYDLPSPSQVIIKQHCQILAMLYDDRAVVT